MSALPRVSGEQGEQKQAETLPPLQATYQIPLARETTHTGELRD